MKITPMPIFIIVAQDKDGRVGVIAEHGRVLTYSTQDDAQVSADRHAASLGPDVLVQVVNVYEPLKSAAKEAFGC